MIRTQSRTAPRIFVARLAACVAIVRREVLHVTLALSTCVRVQRIAHRGGEAGRRRAMPCRIFLICDKQQHAANARSPAYPHPQPAHARILRARPRTKFAAFEMYPD